MTPLEKFIEWLETYPGHAALDGYHVDYTDHVPANAGAFPAGLTEVQRKRDILGNVTVTNQYNFALYFVFQKPPGDDTSAAVNADWVMDFQAWVQLQSAGGLAPTFGDEPWSEKITAQNGAIYDADTEGTAVYAVQIAVQFTKFIQKE